MSKSKKSVFNRPIREVKKPAKKIKVKLVKKSSPVTEGPIDPGPYRSKWNEGIDAASDLRQIAKSFRNETGEQDVSRARLNQFLADLDDAISRVSAAFEP